MNRRAQFNRQPQLNPTILLLLGHLWSEVNKLPVKPIATLFFLGVNILIYIQPQILSELFGINSTSQVCLQPNQIVKGFMYQGYIDLNRLLISGFVHADDMHLYYNMLSLIWKGSNIEMMIGPERFFLLVLILLVLSHSLVVAVAYVLHQFFGYSDSFYSCAVGFSAVLFALKYILNSMSSGSSQIYGFTIPTKYAAWIELVVISLVVPNASFLGHLCGIFAGLLSTLFFPINNRIAQNHSNPYQQEQRSNTRYQYASGTAGARSQQYNYPGGYQDFTARTDRYTY